jgi:hypothetical protein
MHGPKLRKLRKPKPGLLLPPSSTKPIHDVSFFASRASCPTRFGFVVGRRTKVESAQQKRNSPTKKI